MCLLDVSVSLESLSSSLTFLFLCFLQKLKARARGVSPDIRQIDLDVNRTYRDHIMFMHRYDVKWVSAGTLPLLSYGYNTVFEMKLRLHRFKSISLLKRITNTKCPRITLLRKTQKERYSKYSKYFSLNRLFCCSVANINSALNPHCIGILKVDICSIGRLKKVLYFNVISLLYFGHFRLRILTKFGQYVF